MFTFLIETFVMGVRNLHLHKLRSLLTALGIIIGVAAVIIMVAIGEGSKQAALEQLKRLGPNNIVIRSIKPPETSDAGARTQRMLTYGLKRLDLKRVETIPGVDAVVAIRNTEQPVVHNDTRVNSDALGATPNVFDVINLRLSRGRIYNPV